jgi:hypothetical protein
MSHLKESVDLSLELREANPKSRKIIDSYWDDFLSYFLDYVKQRERETGEAILKGLSVAKLLKLLK